MDTNKGIPFGVQTDVETALKLFQEFEKCGAKTRDERNKVMIEFFSRKENKEKVQDLLVGKDDFSEKLRGKKKILTGLEENGTAVWKVWKKEKDKESSG